MAFASGYGNPPGPATDAFAVTPSNTTLFTQGTVRALYIGVTGDVTVLCASGAVTFTAVPVGWFPVNCTRVNSTGTTATNIVGLL